MPAFVLSPGPRQRAIEGWLGHRSITSTAVYTALAPNRFKDFWREREKPRPRGYTLASESGSDQLHDPVPTQDDYCEAAGDDGEKKGGCNSVP
jgi:hypothetical protein